MNTVRLIPRNPTLWLVIGIPLATLFGGYLTLRLAYQSGESDEVPDDVTRTGQAQVMELAPDREAARAGLRVAIAFDPIGGRITATQSTGILLPAQPIELRFVHPLRANEDREVRLLPAGAGWRAALPQMVNSDWKLILTDADGHWRLIGRLPRHAARVSMQPSLPP